MQCRATNTIGDTRNSVRRGFRRSERSVWPVRPCTGTRRKSITVCTKVGSSVRRFTTSRSIIASNFCLVIVSSSSFLFCERSVSSSSCSASERFYIRLLHYLPRESPTANTSIRAIFSCGHRFGTLTLITTTVAGIDYRRFNERPSVNPVTPHPNHRSS